MFFYNKVIIISLLFFTCASKAVQDVPNKKKQTVLIILGSAREKSISKKIAAAVDTLIGGLVDHEIIDLKQYNLPFIDPENNNIETSVDAWRNKFSQAAAVIFLVPNYNSGYSGIIKNAVDALGRLGKDKLIGLIGYSGGYDGGKAAIDAFMPVLTTLQMNVIPRAVLIPMAEYAFLPSGDLKKPEIKQAIHILLESIYTSMKVND